MKFKHHWFETKVELSLPRSKNQDELARSKGRVVQPRLMNQDELARTKGKVESLGLSVESIQPRLRIELSLSKCKVEQSCARSKVKSS